MSEPGYRRISGVGYCVTSVTRRQTAKSHRAFADVGLQATRVLAAAATGRAGEWSEKAALSRGAFYDAIALRLALGFQNDAFEFGFCDQVVNDLYAVISVQNEDRPKLFWDVFLAFDAGEFYPNDDRSIDPVEALTRPRIAKIVRECPPNN
jgi:hypothetical protein